MRVLARLLSLPEANGYKSQYALACAQDLFLIVVSRATSADDSRRLYGHTGGPAVCFWGDLREWFYKPTFLMSQTELTMRVLPRLFICSVVHNFLFFKTL